MNKMCIAIATLVLVLTGFQSQAAQADPTVARLDQEFALHGARQVTIGDADLRLRFTDVLEDSRCPTDVECFWTGQARITVDAELGQDAPASLEFNTNPAPGQGVLTNDVGGYVIELRSLDPYPKTPDDSPALTDYSATLVVRKIR